MFHVVQRVLRWRYNLSPALLKRIQRNEFSKVWKDRMLMSQLWNQSTLDGQPQPESIVEIVWIAHISALG